jgi:hypothetical protein
MLGATEWFRRRHDPATIPELLRSRVRVRLG